MLTYCSNNNTYKNQNVEEGGPQITINNSTVWTNIYAAFVLCVEPGSAMCIYHLLEAVLLDSGITQGVTHS